MNQDDELKKKKQQKGCCFGCKKACGKFWKPIFSWYWRPKPSLLLNIIIFFVIAIIFLVLGSVILATSYSIEEIQQRYDNIDSCSKNLNIKPGVNQNPTYGCKIDIEIKNEMTKPIYFYYEISGFYQNHRRYANSIDSDQMQGKGISDESICSPFKTNKEMGVQKNFDGKVDLIETEVAIPCGVAAKYYFNDLYILKNEKGVEIEIKDTGLVWETDQEHVFNNENLSKQWIDMNNERFIIWMKIAPFSYFRKPWGKIDENLPAGKYTVEIDNNWDVEKFRGTKGFVITETNIYGGRNLFLGYSFIVIGILSLISGILFGTKLLIKKKVKQRYDNEPELSSLVQNRQNQESN